MNFLLEGGAAAVSIALLALRGHLGFGIDFTHPQNTSFYLGGRSERARDDCLHLISRHGFFCTKIYGAYLVCFGVYTTISFHAPHKGILIYSRILSSFPCTNTHIYGVLSWVYREGMGWIGMEGLECISYRIYGWDYITCFFNTV